MNAQELQRLKELAEFCAGKYHSSIPAVRQGWREAWGELETFVCNLAERAVSPAESVQSIDTPEFIALLTAYRKYSNFMGQHDAAAYTELANYANDQIRAAHAEGRRSAMEELSKEKERADRVDNALKEWLDKTQWVQDAVQSNKFSVMYLGHHRADVIRQEFDKLAQPLQQEGGKDGNHLPSGVTLKAFRAAHDDAWWISIKHPFGETNHLCTQARDEQFAELIAAPQPSDNLQQASTAQVETAKGEYISDAKCDVGCKHPSHCRDSDQCTINWYADSTTDAGPQYQARRYCKGDSGWTDWQDVTAEQHEEYKTDPSFQVSVTPAQATPEGAELPPLPKCFGTIEVYSDGDGGYVKSVDGWTADQMRGYAIDYAMQLGCAALAAQQNSTSNSSNNSASTAAEPVDANRLAMWLSASMDQHSRAGEMRQHIQAWLDLNRAAPPQQVKP